MILVCSDERKTKFPFDIQHRNILCYKTGSVQDFTELGDRISDRIKALLQKGVELEKLARLPHTLKKTEGLEQYEIVCLATIMQNGIPTKGIVEPSQIQNDMSRAGYTPLAAALAMHNLSEKRYVEPWDPEDGELHGYYRITSLGIQWLNANQDKLVLEAYNDIPF